MNLCTLRQDYKLVQVHCRFPISLGHLCPHKLQCMDFERHGPSESHSKDWASPSRLHPSAALLRDERIKDMLEAFFALPLPAASRLNQPQPATQEPALVRALLYPASTSHYSTPCQRPLQTTCQILCLWGETLLWNNDVLKLSCS